MNLPGQKSGNLRKIPTTDVLDLIKFSSGGFKSLIQKAFPDDLWVEVFLADTHHGFTHGDQVRVAGMKLLENLTISEKEDLLKEVSGVFKKDVFDWAIIIVSIASIFHDCGRFNDQGKFIVEEQKSHHILSARRAKQFCDYLNVPRIIPFVEEAILCHDFQSREITPYLNSPSTFVGKIVQSADQMGWFHPESLKRTIDYNEALGNPFFDSKISFADRLMWTPGEKSKDALTVMLNQLFGPTGKDRFGIAYAREKVNGYKVDLERNILNLAGKFHQEAEVKDLIKHFRQHEMLE